MVRSKDGYFVNGLFVGEADRRDQSDVYYIGNSSNNEAFAEFIDDVRIYNVSLEDFEISKVYGGGFGDQLTSVKIETNSTADLDVRTFTSEFGKDGNRFWVTDLNISDWNTSSGSLKDINSSVADKYILSLDISLHTFYHWYTEGWFLILKEKKTRPIPMKLFQMKVPK